MDLETYIVKVPYDSLFPPWEVRRCSKGTGFSVRVGSWVRERLDREEKEREDGGIDG